MFNDIKTVISIIVQWCNGIFYSHYNNIVEKYEVIWKDIHGIVSLKR